ncbi:transcriptional regulator GutM, partial [Gilliamella apicola]
MGFVNMNIVIIASVVFVLQSILSLMQIRYYQRHMYNITQQYS